MKKSYVKLVPDGKKNLLKYRFALKKYSGLINIGREQTLILCSSVMKKKKPRIRDHSDDDDDTQAKKLITVLKAELDSQGITRDDQKTEGAKVSG